MRFLPITILPLLFLSFPEANAQKLSQVVEKVIEKTQTVKKGDVLDLRSEKAEVVISRGEPGVVKVKLLFTTSHADKSVAETEMRFHKYAFGLKGNTFFVQQAYFFRDVKKVLSQLSARVEITIPPEMPVVAVGEYTDFTLTNGSGSNDFRMHFGKLILDNVSGSIKVYTNYGDIELNQCTGEIAIDATRSDILLRMTNPVNNGFIQILGKDQIVDTENINIRNKSGTIKVENSTP